MQPFEMVKHTCNDQELVAHYATNVKIHVLYVKHFIKCTV